MTTNRLTHALAFTFKCCPVRRSSHKSGNHSKALRRPACGQALICRLPDGRSWSCCCCWCVEMSRRRDNLVGAWWCKKVESRRGISPPHALRSHFGVGRRLRQIDSLKGCLGGRSQNSSETSFSVPQNADDIPPSRTINGGRWWRGRRINPRPRLGEIESLKIAERLGDYSECISDVRY